jgi:hypothetical protein
LLYYTYILQLSMNNYTIHSLNVIYILLSIVNFLYVILNIDFNILNWSIILYYFSSYLRISDFLNKRNLYLIRFINKLTLYVYFCLLYYFTYYGKKGLKLHFWLIPWECVTQVRLNFKPYLYLHKLSIYKKYVFLSVKHCIKFLFVFDHQISSIFTCNILRHNSI